MKIIYKDLKHGEIKLVPENLDDIWHLYNLIEKNDLVRAMTYRSIEQKEDKIRSKKLEKKRIKLGIEVNEIEFHQYSDRLRIHGIIIEGPQDLGSFHTLNISAEKMDKISIIKKEWKHHHINRIEEAVKNRNQEILTFVSLDEETAMIAVLRQSGIQFIAEIKSNKSGKMYESTDQTHEYYGNILSTLKINKTEKSPIVIVGPGFEKEHLIKYINEKITDNKSKIFIHGTGSSGMNGINEAIKSGIIDKIIKENRVVFETQIIEKLFEEIKKDGLIAYGEKKVFDCLKNGAVDRLLLTDLRVRTEKGEEMLNISKQNNSNFTIVNTLHEAGKKLESIGGFAAFLRYKI
jgi:protein pelota